MTTQVGDAAVAACRSHHEDTDEPDEFLAALLASTRAIAGSERVADALRRIAEGAVAVVPGVHDVGVAVRLAGELSCAAHTSETAAAVDRAQIGMAEGPCLDAIAGADTVVLPDAATETRWPRFVPEAVRHGVRASLSVRLTGARPAGVVNLHVTQHALDDRAARSEAQRSARMFVAYASLALAETDRVENLHRALLRRDLIGQAKGILMHRDGLTADEAFDRLRIASQTTNTKLYDVAAWLVAHCS
ncbi:ANTAR domain-containing protein [Actinomycetospora sp. TBRC 11914]|uniref:ANTAR domain-containing protein n=1 Tax=Actinomycetospora sp. TBRC 11914 TaxID=2729387 RepID=UPI00145F69FD|nr:ANTAR domain-containing protein [Actinomycetospora sp. TBRC 11914]NMO88332.1 ANTAR domain-containing protein [Actinomycetospora sp. TBRC 11914]